MAKVINQHLESYDDDEARIEGERNNFQCLMCFKYFRKQCALKKHERNHNNIKKFHCEVCEKSFLYPKLLKTHKAIHTGEKPFECKICGKCFATLHYLQNHDKTHTRPRYTRMQIYGVTIFVKNASPYFVFWPKPLASIFQRINFSQ